MNNQRIYYSCCTWLSYQIRDIRRGIQKGAAIKRKGGIITDEAYREIQDMAAHSEISKFRPLMLIIPVSPVANLFKRAGVRQRANRLSEEYIIESLMREFFDAVEL